MARLDKRTTNDLVKLLIFIVVTTLATSVLVATIGNLSFTGKKEYQAEFVDATGVVKGDDVRIAGVKVGSVDDIKVVDRNRALVTFTVEEGTELNESTHAAIRYRNLVGQRYLSLTQEVGDAEALDEGDKIPVERTSPALDLTVLFNGFKPLFQALSPDDINKLSYEIVQVFQGEGGTLENLLGHTASITQTLADRDQVIGDLIDNLDYVLDHVADRDDQLSNLITSFRTLVSGLKDDRQAILASLDGISDLSVQTADLVKGIRPSFVEDVKQLRRVAGNVDRNKAELDRALQVLPIKLEKVGRTAIYGSWFNFYLCSFKAHVTLPGNIKTVDIPQYSTGAKRCDLG
jgi:phospholipid/cholesterol/gamma-HCH transport system substrate-binding protein